MKNEKLKRLRKNEKKQTITISIADGNYNTEIIIDLINQAIQEFRSKYQESSIGFENLAYLQSIENKFKCKPLRLSPMTFSDWLSAFSSKLQSFYGSFSNNKKLLRFEP